MFKKRFLILFFLLTNALNANDNSMSITYSNSTFKEKLIPIQNYNNNGLQLSRGILLADYYLKKIISNFLHLIIFQMMSFICIILVR